MNLNKLKAQQMNNEKSLKTIPQSIGRVGDTGNCVVSSPKYSDVIRFLVDEVHEAEKIQFELLQLKKQLTDYDTDLNVMFDKKTFSTNEDKSILYNLFLICDALKTFNEENGNIILSIKESI